MLISKADGTVLTDAVITHDCKTVEEIGKEDYAELKWNSDVKLSLPVGAYFTVNEKKYVLLDSYMPDDTGACFSYDVKFKAEWMILSRIPFVLNTKDASGNDIVETEWTITDKPANILAYILEQIKIALPCVSDALQWSVSMIGDLPASVSCSFSNVDIISALNTIVNSCNSDDYETEWNINYNTKTIYFGVCITVDDKDNVVLKVEGNVGNPSVTYNAEDYFNRFIVKGSTKNITQRSASGENVSAGVRLTLDPSKYPNGYIDTRTDTNEPILTKALVFDSVYPSLTLYCYNVRERQLYQTDDETGEKVIDHYDNGSPVYKKYSIWYIRLAYPTLDADGNATTWTDFKITDDMIVDGKTLTASFEANEKGSHSALAGRDFELTYHKSSETLGANSATGDTGVVISSGDYEIVFDKEDDLVIPTTSTTGLVPWGESTPSLLADTVVLYNIVMSSDYYKAAYVKLENEALKEIASEHSDKNSYAFNSNPVIFEDSTKNPNLYIGKAVLYDDGNGYTLATRVTKLTTNIDFPFIQEIVVGNSKTRGNIETIKEDVEDASGKINAIISGSSDSSKAYYKALKNKLSKITDDTASGLITFLKGLKIGDKPISELLTTENDLPTGEAVNNVILSLGKMLGTFLRKDANDTANGIITFLKGLVTTGNIQIGENFVGGIAGGIGGRIDGNANAELNSLILRQFLEVPELRYNRISIQVGNRWRAPGGGIIDSVSVDTDADGNALTSGIITLHLEEGEIGTIAVDDICEGIYHNGMTKTDNSADDYDDGIGNFRFAGFCTCYFRITEILETGHNSSFRYVLRAKSDTWTMQFHPCSAMHFVSYGNFSNADRQNSRYSTLTYERYLKKVNTWEFQLSNIAAQLGDLSNLTLLGINMSGYSAYLNNIYMSGAIQQLEDLPYEMNIDNQGMESLDFGETTKIVCTVSKGFEDKTGEVTSWSVTRDSGSEVEDTAWALKDKAKNFAGTLTISHTTDDDDLSADDRVLSTLFTFTAVLGGEKILGTVNYI